MISIKECCALLDGEAKHYLRTPRWTFYKAKSGGQQTREGAMKLLVSVRANHPDIAGVMMANGETVYAPSIVCQLLAERDLLAAELAKAQRQLDDLRHQQTPMGPRRFAAPISAIEGNHGGN